MPRLVGWFLASAWMLTAQVPGGMTVKEDNTALRDSCAESAPVVARLKQGDPVRLRIAIAGGDRRCFSVAVESGGQKYQGYVWAEAVAGVERFEEARKQAAAVTSPQPGRRDGAGAPEKIDFRPHLESKPAGGQNLALASQVFQAADALQKGRPAEAEEILARAKPPQDHRDAATVRSAALLELHQYDRALEVAEAALRAHPHDPELLTAAGIAAYQLDDVRRGQQFLKDALAVKDNPSVKVLLAKFDRESTADKSGGKSYGTRFVLRYESEVADPELARQMVNVLEQEYSRVTLSLGCRPETRIVTVAQSREAYEKTTEAPGWSGGQYDGKIRVPLGKANRGIDPATRRVFAHELVHACLASLGNWPAWLHEGLAQKLSGDALSSAQLRRLRELFHDGELPPLAVLAGGFSQFGVRQAALSYALSLVAADLFFQKYGTTGPRNLMNNPETLPHVTASLDKAMAEYLGPGWH